MSNTNNDFSWSDMPIEFLTSVAEFLSPTPNTISNLFHFGSVCKTWRQASFLLRVRRRSSMPWLINGEYECRGNLPVLKFQCSDFWYKRTLYSFEEVIVPKKLGRHLIGEDSKNGWLLFQTSENINPILAHACFFFFNPFRKNMAVIEIPRMNFSADLHIVASRFTTNPTRPDDCHIFVPCTSIHTYTSDPLRIYRIYTCNLKEGEWRHQDIHSDKVLLDMAYMDGAFYCVFSDKGSIVLDIFTIRSKEAIEQAEVDGEQCDPIFLISSFSSSYLTKKHNDDFFLVEADGDLLLTICSHDDDTSCSAYCHVYRFDPSLKEWNRITNLGNRVLFLCSNASGGSTVVAAVRDAKEFANTIFVYRGSQYEHYICGRTEATWVLDKTHRLKQPEEGSALISPPDLWH